MEEPKIDNWWKKGGRRKLEEKKKELGITRRERDDR